MALKVTSGEVEFVSALNDYAKEFLEEEYGLKLLIPIKVNGRLTRSLGRFRVKSGKSDSIELSRRLVHYGHTNVVLDVLRHELIHYALFELGKPYRDGHPLFEAELVKHEATSTNILRVGVQYRIECAKCGREWSTRRKSVAQKTYKYQTSCCKADIKYKGSYILDGTEKIE